MTQNPDATTQAPPRNTLDDLFGRLRGSGFHRDTDRRWFGGVCAGLAARFGVDPLLIRAAAIILTFAGGLGLTAYLVLWLILPDRNGDLLLERALRRGDVWPVVLLIVTTFVIIGGLVSIGQGDTWGASLWVLLPIALVAWFLIDRGRSRPGGWSGPPQAAPPPPAGQPATLSQAAPAAPSGPAAPAAGPSSTPPGGTTMTAPTSPYPPAAPAQRTTPPPYGAPPSAPYGSAPPPAPPRPIAPPPPPGPRRRRPSGFVGLMALGLALALFGVGVALDGPLDFPGAPAVLGFGLALAGVSVVALVLGAGGRAGGFTSFLVFALGFLLLTSAAVTRIHVADGVGDRTWVPVASSSQTEYSLGAGDATLDLSRLAATSADGPQRVSVHLGAGDLTIVVPDGVTARVAAHVGIGDISVDRGTGISTQQVSGTDRSLTTTIGTGPAADVLVTADVGLGQITIEEQ